ncbi:hypothetical protein SLS61_009693 [Didymella pomorum]
MFVRFASDSRATAGDSSNSAHGKPQEGEPQTESNESHASPLRISKEPTPPARRQRWLAAQLRQREELSQLRVHKHLTVAPGDSAKNIRAAELHRQKEGAQRLQQSTTPTQLPIHRETTRVREEAKTVHPAEHRRGKKERAQRAQQADTSTQTDGSGEGSKAAASPTEPATEDIKPLSMAERMRRALGGSDATAQPKISKVYSPTPLTIRKVHRVTPLTMSTYISPDPSSNDAIKRLVSARSDTMAIIEQKAKLRQKQGQQGLVQQKEVDQEQAQQEQQVQTEPQVTTEQQATTSTQSEDELRERLKKLEEQLVLLQAKLAADNAATTAPKAEATGGMTTDTAGAKASDSTPSEAPEAVNAKSNNIKTAEEKTASRKKEGKSAADNGRDRIEEQLSTTRKQTKTGQGDEKTEAPAKTAHSTLAQQIQAQSTSMKSSSHPRPSAVSSPPSRSAPYALSASDEVSDQSLLDELFPEANSLSPPDLNDKRRSPPKLDLPAPNTNPKIRLFDMDTRTERQKAVDAFRARGEQTTVLQLSNCSTALTESDFRRLIPRGKHIDTWSSKGEFYKIIPGRDPLSLARLPFYYLLFNSAAAALAYQQNASRLSKLAALHASSSSASAVPPPAGFLEDGEDVAAVTSSFVLHPQGHALDLRTVMQPYNPSLRALIAAGGYTPIVPNIDEKGNKIHRVLLTIDGYEPGHWDLWQIILRHAHVRGILWPWRNDHASALRRLRDSINLKTVSKLKAQDLGASSWKWKDDKLESSAEEDTEFEDPTISAFLGPSSSGKDAQGDGTSAKQINQMVMNRVYNRWIAEFEDEDAARRFAGLWHRVRLPDGKDRDGKWKDAEEERWVEAEYLW